MKRRLVQLEVSAAFDRVSHRGLLHKLRYIGVGRQLLCTVSEFLSDRKQRESLDVKVSVLIYVVSGKPLGTVLIPFLFILFTFWLFHIVGSHFVNYADDTTIYAIVPRPLLRPQVMESLNQDLAAIDS